jgi:hypothetical protein
VAKKFKLRSNLSSCVTQGAFSKLPCLSHWERVAEGEVLRRLHAVAEAGGVRVADEAALLGGLRLLGTPLALSLSLRTPIDNLSFSQGRMHPEVILE